MHSEESGQKRSAPVEVECIKVDKFGFRKQKNHDNEHDEYNEDMLSLIADLSNLSPCSEEDQQFFYALSDIDQVLDLLGIPWEKAKDVPFCKSVSYIRFVWDIHARKVYIPEEKKR